MTKTILAAAFAMFFFALSSAAQNRTDALEKAQETLRTDLNKNVTSGSYKIKQCVVSSGKSEAYSSSSLVSTRGSLPNRTSVPSDSDSALSTGPGNDAYVAQRSIKLEFDLSKLDPNSISIASLPHSSDLGIHIAPTDKTRPAAEGFFGTKSYDLPFATVIVKKNAASRIADEFRTAIQLCSH